MHFVRAVHADCDNGPTRAFIIAHRDEPGMQRSYDLCFAKRPEVELYDCRTGPDQIVNLAADPRYAETVERLRRKPTDYLVATGDPQFADVPAQFDEYPYGTAYCPRISNSTATRRNPNRNADDFAAAGSARRTGKTMNASFCADIQRFSSCEFCATSWLALHQP